MSWRSAPRDPFWEAVSEDYAGSPFALRVGDLSKTGEDPLLAALHRHHKISDLKIADPGPGIGVPRRFRRVEAA